MHDDHGPCTIGDSPLQIARIEIERFVNFCANGDRSRLDDRFCGGNEGKTLGDDLVACANPLGRESYPKRGSPGSDSERVGRTHRVSKGCLELTHLEAAIPQWVESVAEQDSTSGKYFVDLCLLLGANYLESGHDTLISRKRCFSLRRIRVHHIS